MAHSAVNHRLLAITLTKKGWRKGKFPGAYERATEALSKGCTYAQAAEHAWQWAMRNYTKDGVPNVPVININQFDPREVL